MYSRREFLGTSIGAGASLALTPDLLRAFEQSGSTLIQRAIPSSAEMLPVISFSPRPTAPPGPGDIKSMPTDIPAAREVLKTFIGNGGRVVDVLHGGPIGEQAGRSAANELGIQDKFFWTTMLSQDDPAALRAALEAKLGAFKAPKIDLVMVSAASAADNPAYLTVLKEMKKEGRVRYIGVHELLFPPNLPNYPYPPTAKLEAVMRNGNVDVIATDYHLGDRRLEETILPLAMERKIAAMAYFPFDRGRLLRRAGQTPLPEWAAEFGAKTWAQFFLKYVLSHPAITVVRTGTTKSAHMLENINAGMGRLPDGATRKRMAQFVDKLPRT